MDILETPFDGLKVIALRKFEDQRGSFIKQFNSDFFSENGLTTELKEIYFSVSGKNVLRGMHFQIPPSDHTKLVFINAGRILDVTLDLRKGSKTFGKYFEIELSMENPKLIYIPEGFAHGFLSLEENSIVSYLQTSCYDPHCDAGISYDSFGMNWPVKDPIISGRDLEFSGLDSFNSPF